ncbi:unnamed protein product, partial [Angiostrongylus costaricensis]|uniref:LRRCT domain-containing protein n=1 Tax=Angiostrongylus costaricensis TaxID=334426 RepID=A0A0R3PA51_ANGCS
TCGPEFCKYLSNVVVVLTFILYDPSSRLVRDNSLKRFPTKMIDKFPNATIFNMEGNEIAEIPEKFEQWTSMKGINAANNRLTSFPNGIYNMKHLAILDLSGNLITERLYVSCTSLVQLNLTGNPLKEEVRQLLTSSPLKPVKIILKLD